MWVSGTWVYLYALIPWQARAKIIIHLCHNSHRCCEIDQPQLYSPSNFKRKTRCKQENEGAVDSQSSRISESLIGNRWGFFFHLWCIPVKKCKIDMKLHICALGNTCFFHVCVFSMNHTPKNSEINPCLMLTNFHDKWPAVWHVPSGIVEFTSFLYVILKI